MENYERLIHIVFKGNCRALSKGTKERGKTCGNVDMLLYKLPFILGMYKRKGDVIRLYAITGLFLLYLHIDNHPHYMKKVLLLGMIVLGCVSTRAQKLELGLNLGVTPFIYTDGSFNSTAVTVKKQMGYYGSLRIALMMAGWQVGAAVDNYQMGVSSATIGASVKTKYNNLTPYLFLNKIFRLPKSYVYAGINAGMNFGAAKNSAVGTLVLPVADYSGYNGGAQAGFTLNLAKGLGANIEAGARYMHIQYDNVMGAKGATTDMLAFPVSLGLRYTF